MQKGMTKIFVTCKFSVKDFLDKNKGLALVLIKDIGQNVMFDKSTLLNSVQYIGQVWYLSNKFHTVIPAFL